MPNVGVSIIVPTLNRETAVIECVRDLLAQAHRPLEILIVDQSDQASELLRDLAGNNPQVVRWYRVGFRGLPAARNFGWQQAKYESLVFVDDDIRCGPALVEQHLRGLTIRQVAIVGGGMEEDGKHSSSTRNPGIFNRWLAEPFRGFDSTSEAFADHAPGGNFSIWRSTLAQVGGVDENLQIGAALHEETDLCLRVSNAGHRIYFNGRARVKHLAVGWGGCRVPDIPRYVFGLAHNRAVLIRRHLHWYQWPIALCRVAQLGVSYALNYRAPKALGRCVSGILDGFHAGALPPRCTRHSQQLLP